MDCGDVYIKMCEKAKEIQALSYTTAKQKNGLTFVLHTIRIWKDIYFTHEGDYCYVYPDGSLIVWLPRQDQLQAMLKTKEFVEFAYASAINGAMITWSDGKLTWHFAEWLEENKNYLIEANLFFGSMEQLWLCFVMKQKYHKKFLNGDWVEE